MICRHDISNLKTDINDMIGQKIIVKGSLGRSKEFAKEGTIEKAYSNLFVVKYEENDRTASYTYTDLLTRTVQVDVFDGEDVETVDGIQHLYPIGAWCWIWDETREEYVPSAENGDYSPSNPWDAPGMNIWDFI